LRLSILCQLSCHARALMIYYVNCPVMPEHLWYIMSTVPSCPSTYDILCQLSRYARALMIYYVNCPVMPEHLWYIMSTVPSCPSTYDIILCQLSRHAPALTCTLPLCRRRCWRCSSGRREGTQSESAPIPGSAVPDDCVTASCRTGASAHLNPRPSSRPASTSPRL